MGQHPILIVKLAVMKNLPYPLVQAARTVTLSVFLKKPPKIEQNTFLPMLF